MDDTEFGFSCTHPPSTYLAQTVTHYDHSMIAHQPDPNPNHDYNTNHDWRTQPQCINWATSIIATMTDVDPSGHTQYDPQS